MEFYGIYDNKIKKWLMDGNSLIHYPAREIAEQHLQMIKSKNNDFVVKQFTQSKKNNK